MRATALSFDSRMRLCSFPRAKARALPRAFVRLSIVVACVSLAAACSPASDRPLQGAVPGTSGAATSFLPPTLAPAMSDATPSPAASAAVSPQASPSPVATSNEATASPIIRTLAPAPGSQASGGSVTVSAVLLGRGSDLASADLTVDGAPAGAQIDRTSPREWTIAATQVLAAGSHTAHATVAQESGEAAGFSWTFSVAGAAAPTAPAPPPAPGVPISSPAPR